jgi:hypothetical protein
MNIDNIRHIAAGLATAERKAAKTGEPRTHWISASEAAFLTLARKLLPELLADAIRAVEEMREACAKIADATARSDESYTSRNWRRSTIYGRAYNGACKDIAAAIRAAELGWRIK